MQDIEFKLSVVVCTYNRSSLLSGALDSLFQQTLLPEFYEVLVVDNKSTDNTKQVCENFAAGHENFRYIMESRQGLSYARNRGWQEAGGDYIAYLDDDAKAPNGWCELIRKSFMEVLPRPEIVGGPIYPWYEVLPPSWFSDDMETKCFTGNKGFVSGRDAGLAICGGNMAFRKDVLIKNGGFSADYGMKGGSIGLGEETELFSRIDDSTPIWYDPDIRISHFVPRNKMTFSYQFRRAFEKGRVKARLEKARKSSIAYLRIVFGTALFVAVRAPARLILSRNSFKREWAGIVKEFGIRSGYISNAR